METLAGIFAAPALGTAGLGIGFAFTFPEHCTSTPPSRGSLPIQSFRKHTLPPVLRASCSYGFKLPWRRSWRVHSRFGSLKQFSGRTFISTLEPRSSLAGGLPVDVLGRTFKHLAVDLNTTATHGSALSRLIKGSDSGVRRWAPQHTVGKRPSELRRLRVSPSFQHATTKSRLSFTEHH